MYSVTLARKPLVAALQALKRIAPTRAAHKPILSHVLLRIDPDARRVTLTATDLERTLSVALQADDVARDPTARQIRTDASPTAGPNAWTFPVVDALQALKSTPDASVTLAPGELRHACGSIDVASYPREDFPHFERDPVRTARPAVTYPTPALVRALERVTPFCQKEQTRYAFNAVNLQATPDAFVALATDGRRLIVHAHNADPLAPVDPQRCVVMQIPLDACKVLPALLKGSASVTLQALEHEPEPARTQTGASPDSSDPDALQDAPTAPPAEPQVATWVRVAFGASVLDVKTIEGRFPPYMEVVPQFDADAPPVTLQASDAAALIPTIRAAASVLSSKSHPDAAGYGVHVAAMLPEDVRPARPGRPERPALRLQARYDGRTSAATLPVTVSGRSGHIGVNPDYLAECLDAIGSVGVTIRWNAANRPIRFDPQTGDCVVVLMPKNVNDKALDVRNARYLFRAQLRHALQATPEVPTAGPPALLTRAERAALAPTVRRLQASARDVLSTLDAIRLARYPDADPPVIPNDEPHNAMPDARPRRASHLQGVPEWLASLPQIPDWSAAPVGLVYSNDRQTAWEFLGTFATYADAARTEADRPHDHIAVLPFTVDDAGDGRRRWFATRRLTGEDVRAALPALQATPAPTPDPVTPARDPAPRQIPPTPMPAPVPPARPTLTHTDADNLADRRDVDPVRILAYRTMEQVTAALGIEPTYDEPDPDTSAPDALAWYLQADDDAPDEYAGAAIAVRSIDGSHVDRVWTVQTPADDASRQLAAKLFGDALHDSQDVQTFRDAMDAARGQAHMPEYADRPGFADAVDLARAALGKPARDDAPRQIQPTPPPLYLVPAGPHTLDKTRELDAMEALLSRHPAWNTRPVSIDDALRHRAVPLALKLAYLDATRSLSPDRVAHYRAELVPTVTPAPTPDALQATPAPVDVKPIAPTRPTRAPVATPAGVTFTDAQLDCVAFDRYAPLLNALDHVPALLPLVECLQAHARAQSRPLALPSVRPARVDARRVVLSARMDGRPSEAEAPAADRRRADAQARTDAGPAGPRRGCCRVTSDPARPGRRETPRALPGRCRRRACARPSPAPDSTTCRPQVIAARAAESSRHGLHPLFPPSVHPGRPPLLVLR